MIQGIQRLAAVKPMQLSDRVCAEIEDGIVSGRLQPGEVLLDRQLSEALGVSRTPVREALHRLQASGLVQPRDKGGWAVVSFEERDIRELFELRRVLEPLGLEHLLKRPDEAAVAELASFFDDFPDVIPHELYPDYFERDHAFHKRIVECSGNSRVISVYEMVEKQIHRGRHFLSTGYRGRVEANFAEHRDISQAIERRDGERARELLLHHLRMGEELMAQFIQTKPR